MVELQIIVGSLAFGSVYALVALGVVFIWKSMNVLNFAHGHFLMLGAYISAITLHRGLGWPLWLAVPAGLAIVGLMGAVFSTTVYKRIRAQPLLTIIIATMGLAMLMENAALLIFGSRPHAFAGPFGRTMIWMGSVGFLVNHLFTLGVTLGSLAILGAFMKYTMLGKVLRAVAYDKETAALMGIPVPHVLTSTFALACVLAGMAGILLAPVTFISLDMGGEVGYKAFAALIVGGFGSIPGAIVGSYIVGLSEGLGTLVVGSVYRDVVAFVLVMVVLLLRPRGILGPREVERV